MADDLHGFAEWRDSIESRVSTLEVTVTTEARVRAQMDNDMSDLSVKFDAQEKLLKALRETQSDHTKRLTRLEAGQAKLEAGQAKLEAGQEGSWRPARLWSSPVSRPSSACSTGKPRSRRLVLARTKTRTRRAAELGGRLRSYPISVLAEWRAGSVSEPAHHVLAAGMSGWREARTRSEYRS